MKKVAIILLLMTLALNFGIPVNAQTVKRIQFAKGKSSATVRDVTGTSGVYYDLRVRGGQKMALNLSPSAKVGIKVETAGGKEVLLREERGGFYALYFEEGGDVSIFVGSTSGKSEPFTLTVKITNLADV
ncbi:MAG TPA: hypothetical protein VGC97_24245 [Pyrinomonadaceae bacterium]|jgi:hypothetical protein